MTPNDRNANNIYLYSIWHVVSDEVTADYHWLIIADKVTFTKDLNRCVSCTLYSIEDLDNEDKPHS